MASPAPSLTALLDFETQFEAATQAILETSGIAAYVSEQQQKLPLIHTGINFECGPAIDQLTFLPLGGQPTQVQQEFFRYQGTLEFMISVNRDTPREGTDAGSTTFLTQCRGRIRAAFLQSQWPFDDTNLPYYRVSEIRPNGAASLTGDGALNTDIISLRFLVTFAIQPGAWPTGFPPS